MGSTFMICPRQTDRDKSRWTNRDRYGQRKCKRFKGHYRCELLLTIFCDVIPAASIGQQFNELHIESNRLEDKGVCFGLMTLPVKKISYKSINDIKPEHSPGQGRVSISETYDAVQ